MFHSLENPFAPKKKRIDDPLGAVRALMGEEAAAEVERAGVFGPPPPPGEQEPEDIVTPEELAAAAAREAARAREQREGKQVPFEVWASTLNPLLLESLRTGKSKELLTAFPGIEQSPNPIEFLIQYQQDFYRTQYHDPSFTLDRTLLTLPEKRFADITAALQRGEVDYPVIVAPPQNLTDEERGLGPSPSSGVGATPRGRPSGGRGQGPAPTTSPAIPRTLARVLFDRCIREQGTKIWERTNPDLPTFLEQYRDLTLADLTRTDLTDPDGNPVSFDTDHWLPYLQALYPTLQRPAVTTTPPTIGFLKWEGDPPADRTIHGMTKTIADKSQIDAVRLRTPLATLPQYLALFAQHYATTGTPLDDLTKSGGTWSWLFGIIDPEQASAGPSVSGHWYHDGLYLSRDAPDYAYPHGRLRVSR